MEWWIFLHDQMIDCAAQTEGDPHLVQKCLTALYHVDTPKPFRVHIGIDMASGPDESVKVVLKGGRLIGMRVEPRQTEVAKQ